MPKKAKRKESDYAIRCFVNYKRIFTHELNRRQAKMFRKTANHLIAYLTKEYKL